MMLTAIAAMAENYTIGRHNQLPWHLPADLKHFKSITSGNTVLMGRKTFTSIGKPLPNRVNIVVTRDSDFQVAGCTVAPSIDKALEMAKNADTREVFVIGGAEIYKQLLPKIDRIYLTIVHHEFDGDAYFPTLMPHEWKEISRERHPADVDNPYEYSFVMLERA